MRKKIFPYQKQSGQILAEIILAIAVLAIVGGLVAEFANTGNRLGGSANKELVALKLAEEEMESLRAIAQGNDSGSEGWNRIYRPPDGTGNPATSKGAGNPYHSAISGNAWILLSGEEIVSLSGKNYGRKIILDNVSRDASGNIESIYNSANDDPATQKATVTVSASSSVPVTLTSFFTRYLNEGSHQTDWSGAVNSGPFAATSTVTNVSLPDDQLNIDRANSACGVSGPCIRLKAQ